MLNELARLVTWAALLAGVVVAGWSLLEPSATGRFLVTATIRFEGREMTASQVWEARVQKVFKILPDGVGTLMTVRGEALAFPVSDGETVFLFRRRGMGPVSPYAGQWILNCIGSGTDELLRRLPSFDGSCELDVTPHLAVAKATLNPTITLLDQTQAEEIIVNVRVEGTNAPITTDLVSAYRWIADLPSSIGTTVFSNRIYREDFTTE